MSKHNPPINSLLSGENKDNDLNGLEPDFDFSCIQPDELIDHATNLLNIGMQKANCVAQEHKEVLQKLLNEIQPVDFVLLIRPQILEIIKEMELISSTDINDKTKFNEVNKAKAKHHQTRYAELEEAIEGLKKSIKQKHYVVCIITELLKIAAKKKWNLCKCYDYVYVYNGAFWKQLSKDDLKYFLGEVAIKFSYPEIDALHHAFKDELLKQFITQAHLPTPEPDENKILINLQNGTFEFKDSNWNLKPFDPKDFITYQLPFEYDPNATCPLFNSYLQRVLPDVDSRCILQEFSGFIFTKLNLEKCLVLTGAGQNGKSVFFNILTSLLGKDNTLTFSLGLFNHEYNRARLTNVLLNYSSEKGFDLSPDTFKALVSGEPLQAREPYGKPFTINNKVKFVLNCNELPKETESTEAYFRRFIIIPFDVKIPDEEKDIHLAENIIKTELTGVFNWLLEGLRRLIQQQKFTESAKANNALANFKKQADSVALFIDEFGYQPSPAREALPDLYIKYKEFCKDDGYKATGKNKFSARLESKGFEKIRTNVCTYFYLEVNPT